MGYLYAVTIVCSIASDQTSYILVGPSKQLLYVRVAPERGAVVRSSIPKILPRNYGLGFNLGRVLALLRIHHSAKAIVNSCDIVSRAKNGYWLNRGEPRYTGRQE